MSQSGSSKSVSLGIAAALAAVVIGGGAWLYYSANSDKKSGAADSSPVVAKPQEKVEKKSAESEKTVGDDVNKGGSVTFGQDGELSNNIPIVQDVDSDEDDEEEDKEAKAKELQATYDSKKSQAKKRLDGRDYKKAAQLYTDLIELAPQIPGASKEILTLYNNRSAMFEKLGEFEEALSDISVMLCLQPRHVRGLVRRARILEAQGKTREALHDYVLSMMIERAEGNNPSNTEKIQELCRIVAFADAVDVVKKLRNSPGRKLPTKAYCRNFLENFPSTHHWTALYKDNNKEASDKIKAGLEDAIEKVKQNNNNNNNGSDGAEGNSEALMEATLNLAFFHLVNGYHDKGFELVKEAGAIARSEGANIKNIKLLSQQRELEATELHLRCCLNHAIEVYNEALTICPSNFEASLKLAQIYIELGDEQEAERIFESVMATVCAAGESESESEAPTTKTVPDSDDDTPTSPSVPSSPQATASASASASASAAAASSVACNKAWVLLSRANLWIAKDANGKFKSDAVDKAMKDINEAHALIDSLPDSTEKQAAKLLALIRSVHLPSQVKAQSGYEFTPEERDANLKIILQAKAINPTHEAVMMLEADTLSTSSEAKIDDAIAIVDKLISQSDKDDSIPLVIKANILTQKAFMELGMAQQTQQKVYALLAQSTFKSVEELYEQAIAVEPDAAVEAMTQHAHFKTMIGEDIVGSEKLVRKALSVARSKDEAQELSQLLVLTSAQLAAIEELNSHATSS